LINNELPKCNENTSEEGGFLVYSNDTLNKILSKSSSKLHPLG
jgi:hypothetical protein